MPWSLISLEGCFAGSSKFGERKPGKLTLAAYPRIVYHWHPFKNGDKSPGDYKHASHKRVWLQCRGCPICGEVHEWDAQADRLTDRGGDIVCPACESRASFCSCRSVAADKRLAAEWHEDNPSPAGVALGSGKKHRWRCLHAGCGHVWEASPKSRSTHGTDCPECARKSHRKVQNASLADSRPDLLPEWDEGRNGYAASSVTSGSGKRAWWTCGRCGGSWKARIKDRASRGSGCPRCQEHFRKQPRTFAKGISFLDFPEISWVDLLHTELYLWEQ